MNIPYNREIELRLLGALVSRPDLLRQHIGEINDAFFHSISTMKLWRTIKACFNKHGHAKLLTVSAMMRERGELDAFGGSAELTRIAVSPALDEVPAFLRILTDNAQARALIHIAAKVQAAPDIQGLELIPELRTELDRIEAMSAKTATFRPLSDCMVELLTELQAIDEGHREAGLGTGFVEIDRMLNGMKPGQMIVLAARPSLGKTALGMNIAANLASYGVPVGVFSLEMSTKELMGRFVTAEARASIRTTEDIKRNLNDINAAALRMLGLPLLIDDTTKLTVAEIRARAIEMQAKKGVRIIVIDYLQLIKGDAGKGSNREQEVAGISKGLKALAKELEIPVLVLAQLNRAAEGKERPNLSQLRESGQVESDADVVAFIHRDRHAQQVIKAGESIQTDIIIEKNRSGPCGVVKIAFTPDWCRFDDFIHGFNAGDSI